MSSRGTSEQPARAVRLLSVPGRVASRVTFGSVSRRVASRATLLSTAVTASLVAQLTLAAPTLAAPNVVAPRLAAPILIAPALAAPRLAAVPLLSARAPAVSVSRAVTGPTSWRALNIAIARIPNYRRGVATWVVDNAFGHYGATNLNTRRIHISPKVPPSRLYSVVLHEYAHARVMANYASNLRRTNLGLAKYFRAGARMNHEYAADCMARMMGASWTYYIRSCPNPRWRLAAATLLRGRRL